ncbi:MAG: ABC transporter ATP-binding protein [Alphaproteobacteria bacterium]|nr:ABC transporter ATP-binding protein [Alphaproteobacteria bacterium]
MPNSIIQVCGLSKQFGAVTALDGVSFSIVKGEVFTLLGPSGCGKSTTLRIIAGLEDASGGEVTLNGRVIFSAENRVNLPPEKRNMGMVFQSYAIWPHMTVAENVAYPLKLRHLPRAEIRARVTEALRLVGLEAQADRDAPKLSGGQQQRVALARALVYEPEILLLDEPLSNLDVKLREQMRLEIKVLQERLGLTIIYVTHDQAEALSLSDRIAVMCQGRIEQDGSPDALYNKPRTEFVRDFLGKTVTLPGRIGAVNGRRARIVLDNGAGQLACSPVDGVPLPSPDSKVRVAIRPERITLSETPQGGENRLSGRIETVLYQGDRTECTVRVGGDIITIYGPPEARAMRNRDVELFLAPEALTIWPN